MKVKVRKPSNDFIKQLNIGTYIVPHTKQCIQHAEDYLKYCNRKKNGQSKCFE